MGMGEMGVVEMGVGETGLHFTWNFSRKNYYVIRVIANLFNI